MHWTAHAAMAVLCGKYWPGNDDATWRNIGFPSRNDVTAHLLSSSSPSIQETLVDSLYHRTLHRAGFPIATWKTDYKNVHFGIWHSCLLLQKVLDK